MLLIVDENKHEPMSCIGYGRIEKAASFPWYAPVGAKPLGYIGLAPMGAVNRFYQCTPWLNAPQMLHAVHENVTSTLIHHLSASVDIMYVCSLDYRPGYNPAAGGGPMGMGRRLPVPGENAAPLPPQAPPTNTVSLSLYFIVNNTTTTDARNLFYSASRSNCWMRH